MKINLHGGTSFIQSIDAATCYKRAKFIVLCMLFLTIITTVWTVETYHGLVAEQKSAMRKQHDQTDEYFRGVEQMVTSTYYQLATDYYIEGWIRDAYRPDIDYYSLYLTHNQMLSIVKSNPLIESIYLHTFGNDRVLSTSFMYSRLDDFPHKQLFNSSIADKNGWIPALWERDSGADACRIIPLCLPVTLTVPNGQIVINISESALMLGLPHKCDGAVILNMNGQVLSSSDDHFRKLFEENSSLFQTNTVGDVEISRIQAKQADYYMLISREPSQYWYTVSFVDASKMDSFVQNKMKNNLYVCITTYTVTLIETLIMLLLGRLRKAQQQLVGESLQQSRFAREAEMLGQALKGTQDESETVLLLETMHNKVFEGSFRVVTFEINDYYKHLTGKPNIPRSEINLLMGILRTLILEKWREAAEETASVNQPLVQRIELDKMTAILPELLDDNKLQTLLENIQRDIQSGGHTFCISVSETVSGVENASSAYQQTLHILGFKPFFRKDSILWYNDIRTYENSAPSFPVAVLSKIVNLITQGDQNNLEQEINDVFKELLEACSFSMDLVNAALANILFELLRLKSNNRLDLQAAIDGDLFVRLYSFDNIDDKLRFTKDLCLRAATQHRHIQQNPDNVMAQRIDAFIQEHFDQNISLDTLADEFQMNPSYISALIKRELGLNFISYINELRVKKSLNPLKNSYSTIRKVAEDCGYDDVHTYIRNFKKFYHTTPAEYRKTLWENEISQNSMEL